MTGANRELKFTLPPERASAVLNWLDQNCAPEEPYPEGSVTSVYFDTIDWMHLREKANSDYLKSKLRVRWYDTLDTATAYTEVKRKIGSQRAKKRKPLAVPAATFAARGLDDAAWLTIPVDAPGLGLIPKGPMYPALTIAYHRRRYIEPALGLRLNLDCQIAVTAVNPSMLPSGTPVGLPVAVFEAKGDIDRLPPSLYPITQLGGRRRAYSKYLAGWLAATNRTTL